MTYEYRVAEVVQGMFASGIDAKKIEIVINDAVKQGWEFVSLNSYGAALAPGRALIVLRRPARS